MKKMITLFILLLCVIKVHAADPVEQMGEKYLQEKKREQELEQLKKKQQAFQSGPDFSVLPEDEQCFQVDSISVAGNTLLSRGDIQNVVEKYRQHCLGKNAINQLMQELTALYIEDGYITSRVYIPPQDLNSGRLKLMVIEGYVEGVSINNNSPEDRRKLRWAMTPSWEKHLRLPEIEQALDQINRVRSANAQMKLWPGQKTGATHIQIINETDNEIRGSIVLSNDGQEDTGRMKTRIGFEADNLVGINDNLSVNLITSANTNAFTINSGFPFRNWTFNFSHSYSEYLSMLPENTDLFGQSNTSTLASDYMVYRSQSMRFNITSSVTVRRSERDILGVHLTPQKLVPIRIAANISKNAYWGFISAEVGQVQGSKLFGATDDVRDLPPLSPRAQFSKQDLRITLGIPVTQGLTYQMAAAGQYTDDPLYSSEQITIGDQSTVRGSDTTIASGDRGFYTQSSIGLSGRRLAQLFNSTHRWLNGINLRFFTDFGHVRALSKDKPESAMAAGSGLSFRYKQLSMDMSWSHIVQSNKEFAGQNRFLFTLGLEAF